MTATFTATDLTRMLLIVLGQLERTTAAARLAATQRDQALVIARTLEKELEAAAAEREALLRVARDWEEMSAGAFAERYGEHDTVYAAMRAA